MSCGRCWSVEHTYIEVIEEGMRVVKRVEIYPYRCTRCLGCYGCQHQVSKDYSKWLCQDGVWRPAIKEETEELVRVAQSFAQQAAGVVRSKIREKDGSRPMEMGRSSSSEKHQGSRKLKKDAPS